MSLPGPMFQAVAAGVLLAFCGGSAVAQAPDVPIETLQPLLQDEAILKKAAELREAGELMDAETVSAQLKTPQPGPIALAEPSTRPLRGREIAARARQAYLRLGWYYLCPRCEKWHLQFAGAYPIAADAIVTCHHCVVPKTDMRKGYLIVLDAAGNVLPVAGILARSQTMDVAILRVKGGKLTPLALQDNVAPGDTAYCFSEPLGQHGYFSTGIVNRFFWKRKQSGAAGSIDELKSLRLNVSTDWAPGSSGAAVWDDCGNVIGHVSMISPLSEKARPPASTPAPIKDGTKPGAKPDETTKPSGERSGAVLITLHEAIPARAVKALANTRPDVQSPTPVEAPKTNPAAGN
jgi:hypothetical protein